MKPLILVLMCAVTAVITSCSERTAEPPHGAISHERQPAFGLYVAERDTTGCEDAQAFRNWVSKAHPNVWHEYYSTHCKEKP